MWKQYIRGQIDFLLIYKTGTVYTVLNDGYCSHGKLINKIKVRSVQYHYNTAYCLTHTHNIHTTLQHDRDGEIMRVSCEFFHCPIPSLAINRNVDKQAWHSQWWLEGLMEPMAWIIPMVWLWPRQRIFYPSLPVPIYITPYTNEWLRQNLFISISKRRIRCICICYIKWCIEIPQCLSTNRNKIHRRCLIPKRVTRHSLAPSNTK